MKILALTLLLLSVNSFILNCAFQSDNNCLSCYYGFELLQGKCDTCSLGFIMVNNICVDQNIYQQQMQNQIKTINTATTKNQNQHTSSTQTTSIQSTSTPILPTQNIPILPSQNIPVTYHQTPNTNNKLIVQQTPTYAVQTTNIPQQVASNSQQVTNNMQQVSNKQGNSGSNGSDENGVSFDISNAGVMYLLGLFGLANRIPSNCQQFTPEFSCLKCVSGYTVSLSGSCVILQSNTNAVSSSSSTTINSSTSSSSSQSTSSSQSSSQSSSSIMNSQTSTTNSQSSNNPDNQNIHPQNDPYCQVYSQFGDGSCLQCYFRFYYSPIHKKCLQVNDLCQSWDNLGNCLTCYNGYKLNAGVCSVNLEQTNTQTNNQVNQINTQQTGQNTQSIQNQNNLDNSLNTQQGSSSSSLNNQQQQSSSSNSQQQSIINNQQQPSGSSFTQQTNNPSSSIVIWSSSDPNCRLLGSNGVCSECYYSYYYNTQTGLCVSVNPLCSTWNKLGFCLSCYPGYSLFNNQCVVSGANTNVQNNQNQGAINIPRNIPSTSGQTTLGTSTSTSSNNNQNNGNTQFSTITLINSDSNCRSQNPDGSCAQCYYSFYYDSIRAKKCVSVNPFCRTWNSQGHCLSCYQGYILSSNTCIIQSPHQPNSSAGTNLPLMNLDPNCNTYKDQVCIKCATRSYLDPTSKRCISIDANCRVWTETGICTSCYNGYFVFNQKECRVSKPQVQSVYSNSSLNSDLNCHASDSNGVCTQCIWRFVLNPSTKICMKVNDLCRTWSETTALCTSCYGGYSLTNTGQCRISW